MFKICGLRRGLDSAVQLAVDKNFYLQLIVEKIYAFAVFNDKYLQPYGCSDPNFTSTNSKTEIQSEIIEKQIIGLQIDFAIKQVFLLC